MVSVTWRIGGRSVSSSEFKSGIEKAIFSQVEENIKKRVGSCRCKVHNQYAKVVAEGKTLDKLTFKISGCCEDLVNEVKQKLK